MKKFLAVLSIGLTFLAAENCFAGNHSYKNSAEYQKLNDNMRTDLQNCLNNTQLSAKECVKQSKNNYKKQKKELKKKYN